MTVKKVVVITGGARGIGSATVKEFAKHGYAIVSLDTLAEGQKVADEVNKGTGECTFMVCDVSNEKQVADALKTVDQKYGRVDVLANIAGIVLVKPFDTITWDEYTRTVNVNLGGTFLLCNMASVSGHVGQIDHVMYGATKGAILAMTRALAWELAAWNIRVNSISPGSVDTPMLRGDITLESNRTGIPFEQVKKEREAEQAFKRWADPAEVAAPIYFLASDEASFITGTDLLVDCGWVAK
jgi:NAD(P)-dependent dehydrogenase (short-subunit alcohol dehydrogenase family)